MLNTIPKHVRTLYTHILRSYCKQRVTSDAATQKLTHQYASTYVPVVHMHGIHTHTHTHTHTHKCMACMHARTHKIATGIQWFHVTRHSMLLQVRIERSYKEKLNSPEFLSGTFITAKYGSSSVCITTELAEQPVGRSTQQTTKQAHTDSMPALEARVGSGIPFTDRSRNRSFMARQ